jgi:hypothetical protein
MQLGEDFVSGVRGVKRRCIKRSCLSALVLQATLDQLARLRIQHGDLLVARMQITSYNLHVLGSFPPSLGCLSNPSLLGGSEPTRLSNQPPAITQIVGFAEANKRRNIKL